MHSTDMQKRTKKIVIDLGTSKISLHNRISNYAKDLRALSARVCLKRLEKASKEYIIYVEL